MRVYLEINDTRQCHITANYLKIETDTLRL